MNTRAQKVPLRRRYRWRWLLRCTAVVLISAAAGPALQSVAAERSIQAGDGATHAPPVHFQSEALDHKALSTIRGRGGVGVAPSVNLSIILWDEPGRGGAKPRALVENDVGDSLGAMSFDRYQSVSIGRK